MARTKAMTTLTAKRSSATQRKPAMRAAGKSTRVSVPSGSATRSVRGGNLPKLSNLDKVMFPKAEFTKGQLIDYYVRIAPLILPHLMGRAATLKRFPDGVDGKSFFEKRCAAHRLEWVRTVRLPIGKDDGETIDYCEIRDERTLAWVANLAAIEIHVPLALAKSPNRPLTAVFDLDPGPPANQLDCARVALRLESILSQLGLASVVKTSGGKGLHVLVPLNDARVTFDDTKRFAEAIARTLEQDDPKSVTASMAKAARPGRVFVDWSQNDRHKTTVSVFSARARDEPTVSWPVSWDAIRSIKRPFIVRADALPDFDEAKLLLSVLATRQRLPKFGA